MRLIDADALKEKNERLRRYFPYLYDTTLEELIDEAPTIDAVPSHGGLIGWVCPVCGRGLSPYTAVCPCQNQTRWEITCG